MRSPSQPLVRHQKSVYINSGSIDFYYHRGVGRHERHTLKFFSREMGYCCTTSFSAGRRVQAKPCLPAAFPACFHR